MSATTFKPAPVSSSQFNYDSAKRQFTAEMSSLNGLGRVYPDACDVGFTMVSERTGKAIVFTMVGEKRDGEGELLYEDYQPITGEPFTARIWND